MVTSSSSPGACPAAPSSSTRIRRGKGGQSVSKWVSPVSIAHRHRRGKRGGGVLDTRGGQDCRAFSGGWGGRAEAVRVSVREGGRREKRQFSVSVVAPRVNSSRCVEGSERGRESVSVGCHRHHVRARERGYRAGFSGGRPPTINPSTSTLQYMGHGPTTPPPTSRRGKEGRGASLVAWAVGRWEGEMRCNIGMADTAFGRA